jgi:osmotically-inducible protein OsmY
MKMRFELFLLSGVVAIGLAGCNKASEGIVSLPVPPALNANVPDIEVTNHVKTALLSSEQLKNQDITVLTLKGDVKLIGVLDNQNQINEAIRIARDAEGAHTIHDELTIRK